MYVARLYYYDPQETEVITNRLFGVLIWKLSKSLRRIGCESHPFAIVTRDDGRRWRVFINEQNRIITQAEEQLC